MNDLNAPFPYFGGKRTIAHEVWAGLGDVAHYVEPFFGSGAVLLNRPHAPNCETINDADGLLANFWRAVQHDPVEVARYAAWPVNEVDLHARHLWLVNRKADITAALMGAPDWYDPKAAGWWAWGASCWIGSGWCSGNGPWVAVDGMFTDSRMTGDTGQGVNRKLPHLGNTGQGVNRKLPHLGDTGQGVTRKLPHLGDTGKGINRKLPHLGDTGKLEHLTIWFTALSDRLANTRVACGDWSRVCGPSVRRPAGGVCGIFFDPPYCLDMRAAVYAEESHCAKDVLAWCAEHGNEPDLRIVLAGYDGEHNALEAMGWRANAWKARGGYGSQSGGRGRDNSAKERLWFSPHCVDQPPKQGSLL